MKPSDAQAIAAGVRRRKAARIWNPSEHPRNPAGGPMGGVFKGKGGPPAHALQDATEMAQHMMDDEDIDFEPSHFEPKKASSHRASAAELKTIERALVKEKAATNPSNYAADRGWGWLSSTAAPPKSQPVAVRPSHPPEPKKKKQRPGTFPGERNWMG